jgi:predicted aspartyl protease
MEISTMGRVTVAAKVENLRDIFNAEQGIIRPDEIRTVEVADAVVDTGPATLLLPRDLIRRLGLNVVRTRTARTAAGSKRFVHYDAVRLTIRGRDCLSTVAAIPDDCPAIIDPVLLEILDLVVDPEGHSLIGNPEHGGEQMIEFYSFVEKPNR